jgi:hypothetical protein
MTFGLTPKGNLHGFLAESAEIYEMVLFKNLRPVSLNFTEFSFLREFVRCSQLADSFKTRQVNLKLTIHSLTF